jgi:flavorubredoxin
MPVQEIRPGVHAVGVPDRDRPLFDELIPLPQGTSYNAYLVKGAGKTALIDTVDPPFADALFANLEQAGAGRIDYVVSNHAEQDHSGSLPAVLGRWPEAVVVTNAKCKEMLMDLLPVAADRFRVVKDGDTLDLGGRTLEFRMAPWVHWPETQVTLLGEEGILFSCDFFGAHLALSQPLLRRDPDLLRAAKRYYAEIMMPFRTSIVKHLEMLKGYDLRFIAPSHGAVYLEPAFILDAYRDWVSERPKNEILLPFVSMHGSTRAMVEHLTRRLEAKGLTVRPHNLAQGDIGELAMDLVDAATLVAAAPVFLAGIHPRMDYALTLANSLRPKLKFAGLVSSFSWGQRVEEVFKARLNLVKAELFPSVIAKGHPKPETFRQLDELADAIATKHAELFAH